MIEVRPARVADAGEIAALARALALHVADPDPGDAPGPLLESLFSPDPWGECLVADLAGAVVGFVVFCRRFEAHTGLRSLWIADLAVNANRRGHGIGAALLAAVRQRGRTLGAAAISLEVWTQNHGALRFYRSAGATILDDRHVLQFTDDPADT